MFERIHIKSPISINKAEQSKIIQKFFDDPKIADKYLESSSNQKYLYWDKAKYLLPIDGLTEAESW